MLRSATLLKRAATPDASCGREAESKSELIEIVETAWDSVLPGPSDPAWSWEESGGDSLSTLMLLMHLEKRLGRKLSFDLFDGAMTRDALAGALVNVAGKYDHDARPTIFLVPGLFGDEPILADFRRSFADRAAFELVELSDIHASREVLIDLHEVAAAAASDIARRQPEGEILLAGYSYGGRVAFDVVHHLRAAGRSVGWLGLLDAGFGLSGVSWRPHWMSRPLAIAVAIASSSDLCRLIITSVLKRFWREKFVNFRRHLLRNFRTRFNATWNPVPIERLPILLVFTEETGEVTQERWLSLCTGARSLCLPSQHRTMFEPASLDLLTPVFEQAMQAAWRQSLTA